MGFCGCKAKCYCPKCDNPGTKCKLNECHTDGITATKCVKRNVDCLTNTNKCITKSCDSSTGKCSQTAVTCPARVTKTGKVCKCGTVYCNPSSGCQYGMSASLCPAKSCKDVVGCNCDQDGEFADAPGCIYKDRVCTTTVNCLQPVCNKATDKCETYSKCQSPADKCLPQVCNTNNGKCETVKLVEKCAAKKCHHVSCNPKTAECVYTPYDCAAMNKDTNSCHRWWCDDASGKCKMEEIENCVPCGNLQCPVKACFITKCILDASGNPTCDLQRRENGCVRGLCEEGWCNESSTDVNEKCQYKSKCPEGNACFEPVCHARLDCRLEKRTDVCLGDPCHINGQCIDNTTGQCQYDSPCQKHNCMNVTCKVKGTQAECPETPYNGCTVDEAFAKCQIPFCNNATDKCDTRDVDCDDKNVCTIDTCDLSVGCVHTWASVTTVCSARLTSATGRRATARTGRTCARTCPWTTTRASRPSAVSPRTAAASWCPRRSSTSVVAASSRGASRASRCRRARRAWITTRTAWTAWV